MEPAASGPRLRAAGRLVLVRTAALAGEKGGIILAARFDFPVVRILGVPTGRDSGGPGPYSGSVNLGREPRRFETVRPEIRESRLWLGKAEMGKALIGSPHLFVFFDRGFLGAPVSLLLFSQKCQVVPFSPICQNSLAATLV